MWSLYPGRKALSNFLRLVSILSSLQYLVKRAWLDPWMRVCIHRRVAQLRLLVLLTSWGPMGKCFHLCVCVYEVDVVIVRVQRLIVKSRGVSIYTLLRNNLGIEFHTNTMFLQICNCQVIIMYGPLPFSLQSSLSTFSAIRLLFQQRIILEGFSLVRSQLLEKSPQLRCVQLPVSLHEVNRRCHKRVIFKGVAVCQRR